MAKKQYNVKTGRVAALPRSERLRGLGATVGAGSVSAVASVDVSGKLDRELFDRMFEWVDDGVDSEGNPTGHIRAKAGLEGASWMSAPGAYPGEPGETSGRYLRELLDVSVGEAVAPGSALTWTGTRWEAAAVAAGLDTAELAEYLSTHNYAKLGDIPSLPDLSVYATEVWVASQGYLTEHQDISHLVSKDELEEMFVWVTRADGSRYIKAKAGVVGPWLSTPDDYPGSPGAALAAGRLAALEDVGLSALSEGDVLVWDGTKWTNQTVSVSGGGGLDTAAGDARYVLKAGDMMTGPLTVPQVNITGSANSSAYITADAANNIYINVGGRTPLVCNSTENTVRPSLNQAGIWSLGSTASRWSTVYAKRANFSGDIMAHVGSETELQMGGGNNGYVWFDCRQGGAMANNFMMFPAYTQFNKYIRVPSISAIDGNGMLAYCPPDWSGVSSSQWGLGAATVQGVIRSNNSSLIHYKHGVGSYTIWDSGNDGSGSGLDADMLDGYHSANFVRALYAGEVDTNRDMSDMHSNMTFIGSVNGTANTPNGAGWYNVIQLAHRNGVSDGAQYVGQIALGMTVNHERMYYRTHRNRGWQTVARLSDNVASATKLANTRYLWGNAFNGENGVSGTLQVTGVNNTDQGMIVTGSQAQIGFIIGSGNVNRGIYDYTNGSWMIYRDASTNIHMGGTVTSYQSYPLAFRTSTGSCDWLFHHDGNHFYITQASAKGQTAFGAYRPIALRNDGCIGLAGWAIVAYNGGNVGIGYNTHTPTLSYKLDVNGDIRATSRIEITSTGGFHRSSTNNPGSSWNWGEAAFATGIQNNGNQTPILMAVRAGAGWDATGANRLFAMELLNSGGQLWMAFGGAQRYQFTSGGVFYASAGIWSNGYVSGKGNAGSSDARLKRGLEPIELTVRDIAGAPLVEFDWVDGSGRDMGTIAQYWLTRCKRAVRETPDGYYALDYGKLAVAIGISLARTVADHERRLDKHEMRIENLERRIAA